MDEVAHQDKHGGGNRSIATITLLTVAMLFMLGGCATAASPATAEDPWGTITIGPTEAVQLVAALATTSNVAGEEGIEQLRGVELALANHSSILDIPVELTTYDSACSRGRAPGLATAVTQRPRVAAVIGNTCSSACETSSPIFEAAGYLFVSPGCSTMTPTDGVIASETFARTIYDEPREATLAAIFAYDQLGARRVALVHDGTTDTKPLTDVFESAFVGRGGEVAMTLSAPRGSTDYHPLLSKAAEAQVDLLYAPLPAADGVRLAQQKATSPLALQPLIGGRHFRNDWLIQEGGLVVNGTYAVGPAADGPQYETFASQYRERFNENPNDVAAALAYDATSIVLQAIDRVAVPSSTGEITIGRQALRDELYHTAGYQGASGTITCTAWGDCSTGRLNVARMLNSRWQIVYEP